jgi:5-formyltetrahydrofolate cyclo-ligase
MPEWPAARTVALYAAQASEPDLRHLLADAGKTFCFPRVTGDGMAFHQCQSMDVLRPGPWKLLEPDPALCPEVPVQEIDLLLIPGLAFTRSGGRLGRGGGFYDRFLTGVHPRAVKVGICFHVQLVEDLPTEAHDHEVDWVVTETEMVRAH